MGMFALSVVANWWHFCVTKRQASVSCFWKDLAAISSSPQSVLVVPRSGMDLLIHLNTSSLLCPFHKESLTLSQGSVADPAGMLLGQWVSTCSPLPVLGARQPGGCGGAL